MTITKTVGSVQPYASATFQRLASGLAGADGYLAGAETSDNGTLITVAPFKFIQRGIVVENDVATTVTPPVAPIGDGPWFVTGSTPDDNPLSGANLAATRDLAVIAGGAVVLSYKINGFWHNPLPLTISKPAPVIEAGERAGLKLNVTLDAGDDHVTRLGLTADDLAPAFGLFGLAPLSPGRFDRNDHLVLRQREIPEFVNVVGDALTSQDAVLSPMVAELAQLPPAIFGASTVYVDRCYAAWTYGFDLYFRSQNASNPVDVVDHSWDHAVLGDTYKADTYCWIAGRRDSDGAIIVIYKTAAPDNFLQMVAIAPTMGILDGPVTIAAIGDFLFPKAVLNADGSLINVVLQKDEGGAPPNQQIYWLRASTESATFGVVGISPRLVNGVNSGKNDTTPSIAIDRKNHLHIVYATGLGSAYYGDIRKVEFDENGAVVSRLTFSTFGRPISLTSGEPCYAEVFQYLTGPVVVVNPHDEVYVFAKAKMAAESDVSRIVVYNDSFEALLGFQFIEIPDLTTDAIGGMDVYSTQQCELVLAFCTSTDIQVVRIGPKLGCTGILGDQVLEQSVAFPDNSITSVLIAAGARGETLYSFHDPTNGVVYQERTRWSGPAPAPHPLDAYFASYLVPASVAATVDGKGLQVFNTRPKKMNFPILVGDEGDYQGYDSLETAIVEANRLGGDIVIRGGEYVQRGSLVLRGSVALRGEGLVTLRWPSGCAPHLDILGNGRSVTSIVGQAVGHSGATCARPGDLVWMSTSGFHHVRRVLGARVVLDGVAPVGTVIYIYGCGNVLENLVFDAVVASSQALITIERLFAATLRNLKFFGTYASAYAITESECLHSVFDDVDFTGSPSSNDYTGLWMSKGDRNIVRNCLIGGNSVTGLHGALDVLGSAGGEEKNLSLISCVAPVAGADPVYPAFIIEAGRTTPVHFEGCRGSISAAQTYYIETPVGKTLQSPLGAGPMRIADDNTVAHAPIELTSAVGEFNGSDADNLMTSVNERVKKQGDTLTGNLEADGLHARSLGDSMRFAMVQADRLKADNTGGTVTNSPADIVGDPAQTGDMVKLTGRLAFGNELFDAYGHHSYKGRHFASDFIEAGDYALEGTSDWAAVGTDTRGSAYCGGRGEALLDSGNHNADTMIVTRAATRTVPRALPTGVQSPFHVNLGTDKVCFRTRFALPALSKGLWSVGLGSVTSLGGGNYAVANPLLMFFADSANVTHPDRLGVNVGGNAQYIEVSSSKFTRDGVGHWLYFSINPTGSVLDVLWGGTTPDLSDAGWSHTALDISAISGWTGSVGPIMMIQTTYLTTPSRMWVDYIETWSDTWSDT